MALDERYLKVVRKRLNYDEQQISLFTEHPRNQEVLSKTNELNDTILVLTVVSSHGCSSRHKVGDKFYFDGAGNILTEYCPPKICSYALNNALLMIFAANEFIYAGLSPMNIKFKRCSCFDSGISCGGLGQIVLEMSVTDRNSLKSMPTRESIKKEPSPESHWQRLMTTLFTVET